MKNKTSAIARLFGNAEDVIYKEDLQHLNCDYSLTLSEIPTAEIIHGLFPDISSRDTWRLRMLSDVDEDLFDIRVGSDIAKVYNADELEPYKNEVVRLVYTIEKKKVDGVLTIYDHDLFIQYLQDLAIPELLSVLRSNLGSSLIFEEWDVKGESFSTRSIAVVKKGDTVPQLGRVADIDKRLDLCGENCQWNVRITDIVPDDFRIINQKSSSCLASIFNQVCLLLSACFIADFSSIVKEGVKLRISGFKMLVSETGAGVDVLAFDAQSAEQWYKIYDWCYTGGYTMDRLSIARNLISLNCANHNTLELNPSTLDAIKSNFKIFEKDNVRQYIKVRNDLSKDLLDLQDKINNIVEGFTGDFRKNVVGLGTFFLTLVVVRVVANGQWTGAFSTQIVVLSFVFIALSVVLLIHSRRNLEQKEKLYTKHYGQLRERYKLLLSTKEADKIFEDSDPNKVGTHSNYIKCQKKTYTWIWIGTLVAMSLFLIGVWCYNLFESTNLFKIIKAIVSCCTKNM